MTILRLFEERTTNRSWLVLALLVALISALVLFIPHAGANSLVQEEIIAAPQPQNQFFNDDVKVEKGQVLEGDVVVYGGDIDVEDEAVITGNLVVLSGDVKIKKHGMVLGDLTAFSGDVEIKGEVQGNVASASGDVSIDEEGVIHGDVSVVSGEIKHHRGAQILGSMVEGPNIQMPSLPDIPAIPDMPAIPGMALETEIQSEVERNYDSEGSGFFGWLIGGLFRLLFGLLMAAVLAGLVGIIAISRPEYVEETAATIKTQLALSFGVGLVANVALLVVSAFLVATLCLAPIAVVPILGLIIFGVLSWTGTSVLIGQRVVRYANISAKSATTAVMGALAMAIPIALLWSFGGCFRFVSFLLLFGISSAGSGAFILPWLRKFGNGSNASAKPRYTTVSLPDAEISEPEDVKGADVSTQDDIGTTAATAAEAPVTPTATIAPDAPASDAKQDDFTRISGIGPTFSRRLAAANVRTFAQLAALSADEISEILGWSAERVVRDNLIAQASELASGG